MMACRAQVLRDAKVMRTRPVVGLVLRKPVDRDLDPRLAELGDEVGAEVRVDEVTRCAAEVDAGSSTNTSSIRPRSTRATVRGGSGWRTGIVNTWRHRAEGPAGISAKCSVGRWTCTTPSDVMTRTEDPANDAEVDQTLALDLPPPRRSWSHARASSF